MVIEFKCKCGHPLRATLDGKQIENIEKEYRKCPKCSNHVKVPTPPKDVRPCPKCKATISKTASRCGKCGVVFQKSSMLQSPPSTKRLESPSSSPSIDNSQLDKFAKKMQELTISNDINKNMISDMQERLKEIENSLGTLDVARMTRKLDETAKNVESLMDLDIRMRSVNERIEQMSDRMKEGIQNRFEESEAKLRASLAEIQHSSPKDQEKLTTLKEDVSDLKEQYRMYEKIMERVDKRFLTLENAPKEAGSSVSNENLAKLALDFERVQDRVKLADSKLEEASKNRDELLKKIFYLEGAFEEKMKFVAAMEQKVEAALDSAKHPTLNEEMKKQIEDKITVFSRSVIEETIQRALENEKRELRQKLKDFEDKFSRLDNVQSNGNVIDLQENLQNLFQDFQVFLKKQEEQFALKKEPI